MQLVGLAECLMLLCLHRLHVHQVDLVPQHDQ
jgi:hypothetical protein